MNLRDGARLRRKHETGPKAVPDNGGLVMFFEVVASLMFTLGCMSLGFFIGMQVCESVHCRCDSNSGTNDEETEE